MDFDIGGMLSGLFSGAGGTPSMTSVGDYQMPTLGTDGQSPILGWLNKNAGGLAQTGQGFMAAQPKAPQVAPLQLNIPQAPQRSAPQMDFGSLMPFIPPVNPMTGR